MPANVRELNIDRSRGPAVNDEPFSDWVINDLVPGVSTTEQEGTVRLRADGGFTYHPPDSGLSDGPGRFEYETRGMATGAMIY